MAKLIEAGDFANVLDELSKEVKTILDTPPDTKEMVTFVIYMNTLRDMTNGMFEYLPPGEKDRITDMCAAWLDVGLLLGSAPQLLADILQRTQARIVDDHGATNGAGGIS